MKSWVYVIVCNINLGDVLLMTYGKIQISTDRGLDKSVLNCLGKYIPFWDRDIELSISTHPDVDYSIGLTDVKKL